MPWRVFFGRKGPAQPWLRFEHREHSGGNARGRYALWLALARNVNVFVSKSTKSAERSLLAQKDGKVGRRKAHLGISHAGHALAERNEAGRITERQGPSKHHIHETEDCRVGADAKRQAD